MVKAIVFDLDDTLLDTTGLLIPIANTPEFEARIQQPLPLLPGALENLTYLQERYRLFLLTQGRTRFQQMKVQSLRIENFFEQIEIVDPQSGQQKSSVFEKWSKTYFAGQVFLSIGNRKSTDLRPAKKLGGQTCWFRFGEHENEPEEDAADKPDFVVQSHFELIAECGL